MARQGGSSRCSQDPRYEQRVQEALRSLNDGTLVVDISDEYIHKIQYVVV